MIKRILDPKDFENLMDDMDELFAFENKEQSHFLPHKTEYIVNAFGDKSLLAWDFFVWANYNDEGKFDAMIAFLNNKNEKFGEEIFLEYLWLSKNPRIGQKLLGIAMKFAREKEFKYVMMSCVEAHPKSHKVAKFYEKMGFIKDSETYIAKL